MCFWHPAASIFEAKIPIDWTVGKTSLKSLSRHTGSCQNLFLCQTTWQKLQPKKNGEKKTKSFLGDKFQATSNSRWDSMASHGPQGVSWIWIAGSALPCQVCAKWMHLRTYYHGNLRVPPPNATPQCGVASKPFKKRPGLLVGQGVGIGEPWAPLFELQASSPVHVPSVWVAWERMVETCGRFGSLNFLDFCWIES